MAVTKAILEKWMGEQKRHRLFDKQVQMARELGLNPGKLGKIDNHKQDHEKKSQNILDSRQRSTASISKKNNP